jgi:hypothetical protein
MRNFLMAAACAPLLGLCACATTSFAPPRLKYDVSVNDISYSCAVPAGRHRILRNVQGALDLIDIYTVSYDCAARSAADGRQWFEVPSFLALVGSAAAVTFGAGENVAIAGTVASSVLNAGKAYYVPREKAGVFNRARHALACLQSEAAGIPAYLPPADAEATTRSRSRRGGGGSVSVPFELQYFMMVASRLKEVELILADRLNTMGTYDPAGVAAQIRELDEEAEAADDARARQRSRRGRVSAVDEAVLELDALRPKLDECVVRAKM